MNTQNPLEGVFFPGAYTGRRDVEQMNTDLVNQPSAPWRSHAQVWTTAGQKLGLASQELEQAFKNITVWRQSTGSTAWKTFEHDVTASATWLRNWGQTAGSVAGKLSWAADGLDSARGPMEQLLQMWRAARIDAGSSNAGVANTGRQNMETIGLQAAAQMSILSTMLSSALDGLQAAVGQQDWPGPVVAKNPADPADGPPSDGDGSGDGAGAGNGDGAGGGGGSEDKPADPVESPKTPDESEAKDPVEEAGKLIDVVGKGIDLVGKVPENLNKWLELAQSAKDLLGEGDTTTAPPFDPNNPFPNGPVPDGAGTGPSLAGGTGLEPSFEQGGFVQPGGTTGGGTGGLPPLGSLPGVGKIDSGTSKVPGTTDRNVASASKGATTAAGGPGSAPSLAGQSAATSGSAQQATSPMYPPPMGGGMGAAGNGGRGEIKSGAAPSRPGFSVPAEQTEAERLRRHGVQSDLQGRANGEQTASSGAPPLRKRKRDARGGKATDREVLDEELFRL